MSESLPIMYLARHGETAWSLSGQHTGLTDLPLTERGERTAIRLGERLKGLTFAKVFTTPLQRAHRTCELDGLGALAEIDPDLVEWDYGKYEGRRTADVRAERPGWQLFRDGCSRGESPKASGNSRRSRRAACTRSEGRRPAFFQRAFHSRVGQPLDRCRTIRQCQFFHAKHSKSERTGLRA